VRRHLTAGRLTLAAILAGGLAVRLYGLHHGLPFIYHSDESQHFTRYAVRMFDEGFNPHYFQNPTTFTYLTHVALWLRGFDDIATEYAGDPSAIYEIARLVAVALSLLGVAAVYAVGRRLWGTFEGVVAAAVLAFAALPVAYSRYAVTDVGVLLPVAVAVYGLVKIHEEGALRHYAIAGGGFGLTVAFKYTAGLILVPLLVAVVLRAWRAEQPLRQVVAGASLAGGVAVLVFFVTNPYFVLDLGEALDQLRAQRDAAADRKVGQVEENPFGFYLSSLTWGVGWGVLVAAVAGAVWEFARDRVRAVLLVLFPLLLFLYLGSDAERYFARWLLPAYPILALLAGVAIAGAARSLSGRPALRAGAVAVLTALAMAQPVVTILHTGSVLEKADTRELARNYMLENLPSGTRLVVDAVAIRPQYDLPQLGIPPEPDQPVFPIGFSAPPKDDDPVTQDPVRTTRFLEDLAPTRVDRYRADGYCVVATMSWLRERAAIAGLDDAVAYYDRLERESRVLFRASPYDDPGDPEPFDFDQTHLYWSKRYDRTGPEVVVRELDRCRNGGGRGA
jgi:hypothetical protein